jgi:hypothetical protein
MWRSSLPSAARSTLRRYSRGVGCGGVQPPVLAAVQRGGVKKPRAILRHKPGKRQSKLWRRANAAQRDVEIGHRKCAGPTPSWTGGRSRMVRAAQRQRIAAPPYRNAQCRPRPAHLQSTTETIAAGTAGEPFSVTRTWWQPPARSSLSGPVFAADRQDQRGRG